MTRSIYSRWTVSSIKGWNNGHSDLLVSAQMAKSCLVWTSAPKTDDCGIYTEWRAHCKLASWSRIEVWGLSRPMELKLHNNLFFWPTPVPVSFGSLSSCTTQLQLFPRNILRPFCFNYQLYQIEPESLAPHPLPTVRTKRWIAPQLPPLLKQFHQWETIPMLSRGSRTHHCSICDLAITDY